LEYLFRIHFIEKLGDFILGKSSPLYKPGDMRIPMGGTYNQPEFSAFQTIIEFMQNHPLSEKYPLNEIEREMLISPSFITMMVGSGKGSESLGKTLASICKDNEKQSRDIAKMLVKTIAAPGSKGKENYFVAMKPFLRIDDGLKMKRLEWVFGFPQIYCRQHYNSGEFQYGKEFIYDIADSTVKYKCPLITSEYKMGLLNQLFEARKYDYGLAITALVELLDLMTNDDDIGKFFYNTPPPNCMYASYVDWIPHFIENQSRYTSSDSRTRA